jgi:hypothetical protein
MYQTRDHVCSRLAMTCWHENSAHYKEGQLSTVLAEIARPPKNLYVNDELWPCDWVHDQIETVARCCAACLLLSELTALAAS